MNIQTIYIFGLMLSVFWSAVLTVILIKQIRIFTALGKDISKKNLKQLLKDIHQQQQNTDKQLTQLGNQLNALAQEAESHFQKIGFLRFNPYADTGGDQSFCLCLLDAHNTGFVITSLHSREQTRVYAKPITKGQSTEDTFFDEEKIVLKQALAYHPPKQA